MRACNQEELCALGSSKVFVPTSFLGSVSGRWGGLGASDTKKTVMHTPRGWGPSLLQSACDFWEPVGTLTAALAPPECGFLEVTSWGRQGCTWGQAGPKFPPEGPR